jgi:hypothetical protein
MQALADGVLNEEQARQIVAIGPGNRSRGGSLFPKKLIWT